MVFLAAGLKVIIVSELRTIERWKQKARHLKVEIYALYLAYRDPRVPWYAKAFVALIVGYAFSPIDLIPDFIPVLGYLDDLVLIPLGVAVALKMIPEKVMEDCRIRSKEVMSKKKPVNRAAAIVIICIWLLLITITVALVFRVSSAK
jgi:uncharacterized membrane protein YkvA (DUF1232 family)